MHAFTSICVAQVVSDLRASDLVSNSEAELLVFHSWYDGPSFSRSAYLPVFCTAGKINEAFHAASTISAQCEFQSARKRQNLELQLHAEVSADFEMREAVTEFIELSSWLLAGLLSIVANTGSHFTNDGY